MIHSPSRIRMSILLITVLLTAATALAFPFDRILGIINKRMISLTEVEFYLTFLQGHKVPQTGTYSKKQLREGLEQWIDHLLLLEEAQRFGIKEPSKDEIDRRLGSIQERFGSREGLMKMLQRHAADLNDLRQAITDDLKVREFVAQRIEFFILILPEDLSQYYAEHYDTFEGKSLEEVKEKIKEQLFEQRREERLKQYLAKLRQQAHIEIRLKDRS